LITGKDGKIHDANLKMESKPSSMIVVGGVDTHADTHTVAALDELGRRLGSAVFPASRAGYRALTEWLAGYGRISAVGVEGTGSYGAGLTRWLSAQQIMVVEVNRPNRAERRRRGKKAEKAAP
jgi:transposase